MITSVSLNPSIDRTVTLDGLNVGGLNRVASQVDVAAGKGVNVALAVAALGGASECIGFMYEKDAALFASRLEENGVGHGFIALPGSVRVNMKLFDRKAGVITELNAKGQPVDADALARFRDVAKQRAAHSGFMVLSGSLPPACPADFYGTVIADIHESGCRAILDADGDRLRAGLAAKPFLIKPNISELEGLCGRRLETTDDILKAANGCIDAGCAVVAVSLGADGALITDGKDAYRADGLKITVRSTVAAGDSMVAGLAVALDRGDALEDAFRLGVAAATARCSTAPEEALTGALVRDYAERLSIRAL